MYDIEAITILAYNIMKEISNHLFGTVEFLAPLWMAVLIALRFMKGLSSKLTFESFRVYLTGLGLGTKGLKLYFIGFSTIAKE